MTIWRSAYIWIAYSLSWIDACLCCYVIFARPTNESTGFNLCKFTFFLFLASELFQNPSTDKKSISFKDSSVRVSYPTFAQLIPDWRLTWKQTAGKVLFYENNTRLRFQGVSSLFEPWNAAERNGHNNEKNSSFIFYPHYFLALRMRKANQFKSNR